MNIIKKNKQIIIIVFMILLCFNVDASNLSKISVDKKNRTLIAPESTNYSWYFNNVKLPIEGQVLKIKKAGIYSLKTKDNNGKEVAKSIKINLGQGGIISVVYLIGDSTVANYTSGYYPKTGWGQVLQSYFDETNVVIDNRAIGGTSAKSFYDSYWADVIKDVQPGDYVFVQFGINDANTDVARYSAPFTGFQDYLTLFVNETKAKGATCVLVATLRRNSWNNTTPETLYNAYHDYPVATRQLAVQLNTPLIDLDKATVPLLEPLGSLYTGNFMYMNLKPGEYPTYPTGQDDDVHFQRMGAIEMARLVVQGIKEEASSFPSMNLLVPSIKPVYDITVSQNNVAAGLVTRSQSFTSGTNITLKAYAFDGYLFKGWQSTDGITLSTNPLFSYTTGNTTASFVGVFEEDPICPPMVLYTQVNDGVVEKTNKAIVNSGNKVVFSATPLSGGSWSWTGPNSFSANTREITLNNIQVSQAGEYIASYTSEAKCVTQKSFNATVDGKIGGDGTILLSATANADKGTITLNWTLKNITASVQVFRDTDSNPTGRSRLAILSNSTTQFTDVNVVKGTTYYYWVTAIDINGNTKSTSTNVTAEDNSGTTSIWLESECGNVGNLWDVSVDINASNGKYTTIKVGYTSGSVAPDVNGQIIYNFNVTEAGDYGLWARTIAPNVSDDSFWISIDNGAWFSWNNIAPSTSWVWSKANNYTLSIGTHTLKIGYREDGAKLDKILITNTRLTPTLNGADANNCGELNTTDIDFYKDKILLYPNPIENTLTINGITTKQSVSIYDIAGRIVKTVIIDQDQNSINLNRLKTGVYFILINENNQLITKKFMKL